MKVYKTQEEVDADLVDGNLIVDDCVKFECNVTIPHNINAYNIDAHDITAYNIDAHDITAYNIAYYAFCVAYGSIDCTSYTARRQPNSHPPICLDGELTIKKKTKEVMMEEVCKMFGYKVTIRKED